MFAERAEFSSYQPNPLILGEKRIIYETNDDLVTLVFVILLNNNTYIYK